MMIRVSYELQREAIAQLADIMRRGVTQDRTAAAAALLEIALRQNQPDEAPLGASRTTLP